MGRSTHHWYTGRMPNQWDRLPDETNKAWKAFGDFLQLGGSRTLRALSGAKGYSKTGVRKWSAEHDWTARAAAYDDSVFELSIQGREKVREVARQALTDDTAQATKTLAGINYGRMPMPKCLPECTVKLCICGTWLPVLSRHGELVGRKPAIAPATRQAVAFGTLALCGLTPPKRVEVTGADGEAIRLQALLLMGKLGDAELGALAVAFALPDDPDAD